MVDPDWISTLIQQRKNPDEYLARRAYSRLPPSWRVIGTPGAAVPCGDCKCHSCHWIAYLIDSGARQIRIADSMRQAHGGVDSLKRGDHRAIIEALQWWLAISNTIAERILPLIALTSFMFLNKRTINHADCLRRTRLTAFSIHLVILNSSRHRCAVHEPSVLFQLWAAI